MVEYRIHGRGGQGSVAAAYLLASAAFEAGNMCQAFPAFGAERRGAPVTAFVRIDDKPINLRSQVRTPDYLIIQDETLLIDPGITAGLRAHGGMVVNSMRDSREVAEAFGCRARCVPATSMAVAAIGRPIPNTALLAALITLTGQFPLSALEKAIEKRFSGEILDRNLKLVRSAAETVPAGEWRELADA